MSKPGDDLRASLEQVRAYWDGRAQSDLPDLEKLEWWHPHLQRVRYEAFLLDHDLEGRSVLDLGCGLGHFYEHLRDRGIDVEYVGYDLSPAMIEHCRARFPDQRFECGDFLSFRPRSRFDYSVAFGIHSIYVPNAQAILEQVTRHQFALTRVAAHVDVLTDRHVMLDSHLQTWSAEKVLALALSITPHVALHHDCLPTEFSVTLYRAPIYRSRFATRRTYDFE